MSTVPQLRRLCSLAILVLLCVVAQVNRGWAGAQVVLFDQAHGQRFVIEEKGPLHLSGLAERFRTAGYTVQSSSATLTDLTLAGIDVLVISGPFATLTNEETAAVTHFLDKGGRLAAMLHIGPPLADLLHRLDVDFSNYVLSEQENIIKGDPRNFRVKGLTPHPLFGGMDQFSLYGGWALMNTGGNAGIIAATTPRAWVDLDGNRQLSAGDPVQSFGVVVAGNWGNGRFVIFGDDAIFQNQFLDEANGTLADNLANWLR
ncbi:MAG TPA: DUF4350 domain-containing protein [Geobacteraceae bacterium]